MLFNSYEFIFLFLPILFLGYFALLRFRLIIGAKSWLVGGSLFFYSWWNPVYLPLILASILVNYTIGSSIGISRERSKTNANSRKVLKSLSPQSLLIIGLVFNIGLLGYFKYADFFIENWNGFFGADVPLLHIALPLAISFFTLQQIAYLVDSYEGLVKENDLLNYAIFVTFFPQLIAGPIVHHKEMMPQFKSLRAKIINYKNIAAGLFLFNIGLFKKVVIADTFSVWANNGFDHAEILTLFEAWMTSLSYTFQLYFDFSGYADMALGAALLFNIKLPINFNSPYKATGIIDFWKRWHITLTTFLTTYLYTPILKSFAQVTFFKAMIATFITMFVSGIWHGAGWTFVIWGSMHGVALVVNHYWKKTKIKMNRILAWLITFNFINMSFVMFRAKDMESAEKVYNGMLGITGVVLPGFLSNKLEILEQYGVTFGGMALNIKGDESIIPYLLVSFLIVLVFKNSNQLSSQKPNVLLLLYMSLLTLVSVGYIGEYNEFLYFNF